MDLPDVHTRIASLEAELHSLKASLAPSSEPPTTDRRGLVKLLAAGAVGAVGGAVALSSQRASAADTNPVLQGGLNEATNTTQLTASADSALFVNGSLYGLEANGDAGNALFIASGPPPLGEGGVAGALWVDSTGTWWICVAGAATSAVWRSIGGPASAGQLNLLPAPRRAYDSRPGATPGQSDAGHGRAGRRVGGTHQPHGDADRGQRLPRRVLERRRLSGPQQHQLDGRRSGRRGHHGHRGRCRRNVPRAERPQRRHRPHPRRHRLLHLTDRTADVIREIELRSDNAVGVAPEILAAVAAANTGSALAYGADAWTTRLQQLAATTFERADVTVFPVVSGTAANSLALAALCPPWGAVLCHESAHILRSECGATSMFSGGGVMRGLPGAISLLDGDSLSDAFATTRWGDPHHSQPAVLSLTSPTDLGAVYPVALVAELAAIAKERGLRVHLDGARIANAIAALGCTPAELTWRAGVDVLSLGANKNGALSTDAIVCFDAALAEQLVYRIKRAGHVASKMRFQSAQLEAYLTDGLWLRLASQANAAMARLTAGLTRLAVELQGRPDANIAFVRTDPAVIERLDADGVLFYRTAPDTIRLVTSFQTTEDDVDEVLTRFKRALH
jgi:threonine aldolase